jgi:hypothetical protein
MIQCEGHPGFYYVVRRRRSCGGRGWLVAGSGCLCAMRECQNKRQTCLPAYLTWIRARTGSFARPHTVRSPVSHTASPHTNSHQNIGKCVPLLSHKVTLQRAIPNTTIHFCTPFPASNHAYRSSPAFILHLLRVIAFDFLFITSPLSITRRILTAKQTPINQLIFSVSRSFRKFLHLPLS